MAKQHTRHGFDLNSHPLNQVDRGTDVTLEDMSSEEIEWFWRGIFGRSPVAGEVDTAISYHKEMGQESIKFMIHGAARPGGEIERIANAGSEYAKAQLEELRGWEKGIKASVLDKVFGWTGVHELSDPMGFIYEETFGNLSKWTGIKEFEEYGPTITEIVMSFVNPALGVAMATNRAMAEPGGDWGDVALAAGEGYVKSKVPGHGNIVVDAAVSAGYSAATGGNTEENMYAALSSASGTYFDEVYPEDIIFGIEPKHIAQAAIDYKITGNAEAALVKMAARGFMRREQEKYRKEKMGERYEEPKNPEGNLLERSQKVFADDFKEIYQGMKGAPKTTADFVRGIPDAPSRIKALIEGRKERRSLSELRPDPYDARYDRFKEYESGGHRLRPQSTIARESSRSLAEDWRGSREEIKMQAHESARTLPAPPSGIKPFKEGQGYQKLTQAQIAGADEHIEERRTLRRITPPPR